MNHVILSCFVLASLGGLVGCGGGPSRTETTTSASQEHTVDGHDIHHTTTETTEVRSDGSRVVDHTETTQTQTPPPSSTPH